jgi:hypothetical protein
MVLGETEAFEADGFDEKPSEGGKALLETLLLAGALSTLSIGSGTPRRAATTEGSHLFLGGAGEALVINPAGEIFRGRLGVGVVPAPNPGTFHLDFSKLTRL